MIADILDDSLEAEIFRDSEELFQRELSLEDMLNILTLDPESVAVYEPDVPEPDLPGEEDIILIDKRPDPAKLLLYELEKDTYGVYIKVDDEEEEDEHNIKNRSPYDVYIPTGVTVRRVPQGVLGTGVLGRTFIGQDYIEILDSLFGDAYQEVLAHEVFHVLYPEKKEMEIRHLTKNYIGDQAIYH